MNKCFAIASELTRSLIATLALALLLCGLFPLIMGGLAQGLFSYQANGSMILRDGKALGSVLIGQNFTAPQYFHPRPSAAGYDAWHSGGSNLGPTSKKLIQTVTERIEAYRSENALAATTAIPPDAVTASASGLDPHISVSNARLQAARVAQARGISETAILAQIEAHTEGRAWGIFGDPRVHVLKLNLALDEAILDE